MVWHLFSLSTTRSAPIWEQEGQKHKQKPDKSTEAKTSAAWTVMKAPFVGTYYTLKYIVNFPLISFPKNGDLKSLALGTALIAGVGSAILRESVPLNSGLGVAGAAVSILLAVNIIRGLAIPLFLTGAGLAGFSYKNPEAAKQYGSQAFEWVQTNTNSFYKQIAKAFQTPVQTISEQAAEAQTAADLAMEAAKKAQSIAQAAKTAEAKQAAELAIKTAQEATEKANATKTAAQAIQATAASAQKGLVHSIYSKMALGVGVGMHFAGTGASLIGEGTAAAGLEALKSEYSEEQMKYITLAVKLTPVALGAIAGSIVATSTGLGIIYIALPSITVAATRTLDWYSGSKELNAASKNVKLQALKAIEITTAESDTVQHDATKACALIMQGIALDSLGNLSSMLGLGLVQVHGGFMWSLGTSLIGRVFMIKGVNDWYTGENTSVFETAAGYGHSLFQTGKRSITELQTAYKNQKKASA